MSQGTRKVMSDSLRLAKQPIGLCVACFNNYKLQDCQVIFPWCDKLNNSEKGVGLPV